MQGQQPAVDFEALQERLGGDDELLRELVGLYFEDEDRLLAQIDAAVVAGDAEALRRSAHTLKGAVSNFCADPAMSAALALEMAGRDGKMTEAPSLLAGLVAELARVRAALSPYRG